jgi:putative transposase
VTGELDAQVETFAPRIGVKDACCAFGVNERSFRHRRQKREGRLPTREKPIQRVRKRHPAALTAEEKLRVLDELCSDRFRDDSPAQVFHTLLDEEIYLCSVRQMYRLLEDHGLLHERRRGGHQRRGLHPVPMLEATGPNECWTWDITKLRGPAKGVFFFLYSIIDIYSRQVVGWTVASRESEIVARELIEKTCRREGVDPGQLTLHADRGSPMIAGSVAELLEGLGVNKSHSRPRVSNDNPFVEAHFKTLKYHPDYPERFGSIQDARAWCRAFFTWYNHQHYHSGIGYLKPADLHEGKHHEILEKRQVVLDAAHAEHPERFHKRPQPATPPEKAWINRPTLQTS